MNISIFTTVRGFTIALRLSNIRWSLL